MNVLKTLFFIGFFVHQSDIASAQIFADGGYQSSPVECHAQWTYKEKLENGDNEESSLSGCVSIEDFKPFPYFDPADSGEIANLLEPSNAATDKTMWCPLSTGRDVYNPTPQLTDSNKFNWGYCLDLSSVETPETDPPSNEPTQNQIDPTPQPTPEPTPEVTDPRTDIPTKAPVSNPTDPPAPVQSPTEPIIVTDPPQPSSNSPTLSPVDQSILTNDKTFTPATSGLSSGMLMGIVVATVLVVIAIGMLVIATAKIRAAKSDGEFIEHEDTQKGTMRDVELEANQNSQGMSKA